MGHIKVTRISSQKIKLLLLFYFSIFEEHVVCSTVNDNFHVVCSVINDNFLMPCPFVLITSIWRSDGGGNDRKTFVMVRCERGDSYTAYKKLWKRKVVGSVKCACSLRLRDYLLSVSDWGLKVGDGEHNHEMAEASQGHKFAGCLRPEENRLHSFGWNSCSLKEVAVRGRQCCY